MMETCTPLGDFSLAPIGDRWVLVVGGVTREGNRRARRAGREAVARGLDAVWLDGFEELDPNNGLRRLPISELDGSGRVHVATFRDPERNQILNRLTYGRPRPRVGSTSNVPADPDRPQMRRGVVAKLTRRVNQVLRGFLIWRRLRPTIMKLAAEMGTQPEAIIYCDELSIPTSWHAARIWRDAPTGMELGP